MNKTLPIIAAILCGLVTLLDFFVPNPQIDAVGAALLEGVTILGAFALLLGILNIVGVHGRRALAGQPRRGLSVLLLLALLSMFAAGVALPTATVTNWLFDYLYYPLQSTMTALLAFFVVTAAYRAFRVRNVEAAILLITSLFLLLTQLPFAPALPPQLGAIRDWLLDIPVTAATRGIIMGTSLGIVATSLRVLTAIDRPYTRQ